MNKALCTLASILSTISAMAFEGTQSQWNGGTRYDFRCADRDAIVVVPQQPLPGNPWVWRPAFFDAFPQIDIALLNEGFHIAYFDTTNEWGRPEALAAGEQFYRLMVDTYGLMPKVTMEGLSRGGYYSLRWGQTHPETVACLLLDNPLCDLSVLESHGEGWDDVLRKYGVDSLPRDRFRDNAIYNNHILVENHVPIIALVGGQDPIVPFEGHVSILKDVYDRWGEPFKLIVRPHGGHHPHSLDNPAPVVAYLKDLIYGDHQPRPIRVACIGNSVTEGVGTTDASQYAYPAVLQQMLGDGYDVRNFGVSCSTVLKKGTDAGRPFGYHSTERYKQALEFNPDIVIIKLGGNDSKPANWQYADEFERDYQDIIDAFKYLPTIPEIYICLPVSARIEDPHEIWGINPAIMRNEIAPLIEKIAHDNRITTIPLYDAYFGEDNACFADNVHPTNRGNHLIARKIYRALLK